MAKKNIICPYCFNSFLNLDVEYQCENNETDSSFNRFCPEEIDQKYTDHWNEAIPINHVFKKKSLASSLFGSVPGAAKCDVCGAETSKFVCPHCHNWLPAEMIEEGSEIISIVGDPASGKTVYFTSLIHELMKYGYRLGLSVTPKDEAPDDTRRTSVIYRQMATGMFNNNKLPAKTPEASADTPSIPLIFSLSTKKAGKKGGKTIYLVFYDTPGESFKHEEQVRKLVKYLKESSGIIMLIDPFSVRGLRDIISNVAAVDNKPTDEIKILDTLKNYASSQKSVSNNPLAITFSKIDAVVNGLAAAGEDSMLGIDLKRNSSFLQTGKFSLLETEMIHKTFLTSEGDDQEGLLQKWDIGNVFSEATSRFSNVKLFAVSSTGVMPKNKYQLEGEVKPYRVMDPLIWILHEMGGFNIPVEN